MGHSAIEQDEYSEAIASAARDFLYLPNAQRYTRMASATNTDRLDSIKVRPFHRAGEWLLTCP